MKNLMIMVIFLFLSSIVSVHAGWVSRNHGCFIDNGEVKCWGKNEVGETDVPVELKGKDVIGLVTGGSGRAAFSCAITYGAHQMTCWGNVEDKSDGRGIPRKLYGVQSAMTSGPQLWLDLGDAPTAIGGHKIQCRSSRDPKDPKDVSGCFRPRRVGRSNHSGPSTFLPLNGGGVCRDWHKYSVLVGSYKSSTFCQSANQDVNFNLRMLRVFNHGTDGPIVFADKPEFSGKDFTCRTKQNGRLKCLGINGNSAKIRHELESMEGGKYWDIAVSATNYCMVSKVDRKIECRHFGDSFTQVEPPKDLGPVSYLISITPWDTDFFGDGFCAGLVGGGFRCWGDFDFGNSQPPSRVPVQDTIRNE